MDLTRQEFLKALIKLSGVNYAFASEGGRDLLVVIFLRGGCDALNFLAPLDGDDRKIYEDERPNLKLSNSGPDGLLKISDRLGLHPNAKPLVELFQSKKLAIIQAAGLPSNTRSHFDAQAYMELGTPDKKGTGSGWIARHLESVGLGKSSSPFTAVNIGPLEPTSLLSFDKNISLVQPNRFNFLFGDKNLQQDMMEAMESFYHTGPSWLSVCAKQTLDAVKIMASQNYNEKNQDNSDYPKGEIGNRLRTLAEIIRMEVGLHVATVDMGGWDTHKYQGQGTEGTFAKQVEQLSGALHAFYSEMSKGPFAGKMTVVVMTEFGRRLRENANRGTDHGHGGLMMVLGEKVNGGKIYGKWPGLKTDSLYERADLAVTTDFRAVLAEVVQKRLGNPHVNAVFPGFKSAPLGVLT
jgi:uncharacterized protein (DUF1501 family)